MDAEAAYRRATEGDFTEIEGAIAACASSRDPRTRGLGAALTSLYAITFPDRCEPPARGEIERLANEPDAAIPVALALRQRVLHAALELDAERVAAWRAPLEQLAGRGGGVQAAVASLARRWHAALTGTPLSVEDADIVRDAARAVDPGLTVERESLVALDALLQEHEGALAAARRASRMAASEGVLQGEYLANLVLARARRRLGQGHAAVRIFASLAQVLPRPWQWWLGFERALAGDTGGTPLEGALTHLGAGRFEAFEGAFAESIAPAAGLAELARELDLLGLLLNPYAEVSVPWTRGEVDPVPHGLRDPSRAPLVAAFVVARPGGARRVLAAGAQGLSGTAHVLQASTRGRRNHEAMSILALAGAEGVEAPELFRRVYGFELEDPTHEEVFRALLHRARRELGDAAEIARDGSRLRFVARRAVVIPDPRCEVSVSDRALTYLAASGGRATAREVATALRIAHRTVQRALGDLVDEGLCIAEPDGRRVEYVVEDTTFHEPTLHRLRGRS